MKVNDNLQQGKLGIWLKELSDIERKLDKAVDDAVSKLKYHWRRLSRLIETARSQ